MYEVIRVFVWKCSSYIMSLMSKHVNAFLWEALSVFLHMGIHVCVYVLGGDHIHMNVFAFTESIREESVCVRSTYGYVQDRTLLCLN